MAFLLKAMGLKFLLLLSAIWWMRIRSLCKLPGMRDWLWGSLDLSLVDRAMFSKPLIKFSADGWGCALALQLVLRQSYLGVCCVYDRAIDSMVAHTATSSKRTDANMLLLPGVLLPVPLTLQQAAVSPCFVGDSQTLTGMSGSVSLGMTAPFSWVCWPQDFVCALQESVSPVLWKFCNQIPLAFNSGPLGIPNSLWEIWCGA